MSCLTPPLGYVHVVQGRIIRERPREGDTEIGHGGSHGRKLRFVELVEDAPDDPLAQDLDVIEHLASGDGDPNEHDPAVARDADAFHEPSLLDAIDEAGRGRQRDVEHLGQAAHRELAVTLEHVHHMELRHADAEPDEPFAADTLELAHRRLEIGHDGRLDVW
jgi:hypothetical protein